MGASLSTEATPTSEPRDIIVSDDGNLPMGEIQGPERDRRGVSSAPAPGQPNLSTQVRWNNSVSHLPQPSMPSYQAQAYALPHHHAFSPYPQPWGSFHTQQYANPFLSPLASPNMNPFQGAHRGPSTPQPQEPIAPAPQAASPVNTTSSGRVRPQAGQVAQALSADPEYYRQVPAASNSTAAPEIENNLKPPDIQPTDVVIAVMGITGSGKTTFVQHFANRHVEVGHSLESCTQGVDPVPCTFENNRSIWLIDTPGFDDTYRTDTDVLREVAQWLSTAYKKKIQLTGIIYLHRISDTRVGNAATRNLRMFKKLCGEDGLASVVLATTMWSEGGNTAEESREKELQSKPDFWKNMIHRGSKVFRHDRGRDSAVDIINYLIGKRRPVTLDIQKEMIDQKKKLVNTGAGAEVASEMEAQSAKWQEDLKRLTKELREANQQRDLEAKAYVLEETNKVEKWLKENQKSLQKLQADSDQLHQQMKNDYVKGLREIKEQMLAKDRLLEEVQREAREVQLLSLQSAEIERLKLEQKLKDKYYNYRMATRCVVM